jgi:hypothetical protein
LAPLSLRSAVDATSVSKRNSWVVAAFLGTQPLEDYTDWLFPTKIDRFMATYHEVWQATIDTDETYYLEQLQFHLYCIRSHLELPTPVLALHSEPVLDSDRFDQEYSLGPHLHITHAAYPLRRAHLALEMRGLLDVLSSVSELNLSLLRCLTMINGEILSHRDITHLLR